MGCFAFIAIAFVFGFVVLCPYQAILLSVVLVVLGFICYLGDACPILCGILVVSLLGLWAYYSLKKKPENTKKEGEIKWQDHTSKLVTGTMEDDIPFLEEEGDSRKDYRKA